MTWGILALENQADVSLSASVINFEANLAYQSPKHGCLMGQRDGKDDHQIPIPR